MEPTRGERAERRLAVILAADVGGYSRVMGRTRISCAGSISRLGSDRRPLSTVAGPGRQVLQKPRFTPHSSVE